MSRRGKRGRSSGSSPRTGRIGSTLREIIGDELARIDDDDVAFVTVTDVEVDAELTRARVYLSSIDLDDDDVEGVRRHAGRIRRAVADRTRIRRVPELEFMIDPGLRAGTRVDDILRDMADDRAFASTDEEE